MRRERIPVPAGTVEARRITAADGVDMRAVIARRQAAGFQREAQAALYLARGRSADFGASGVVQYRDRRPPRRGERLADLGMPVVAADQNQRQRRRAQP